MFRFKSLGSSEDAIPISGLALNTSLRDANHTQAHQAHVHTVENKAAIKKSTTDKKSGNKNSNIKHKDAEPKPNTQPTAAKESPKLKPNTNSEPQTHTHRPIAIQKRKIIKQRNTRATTTKPKPEEESDPMVYVAITIFIVFLACLYKIVLK